MENILAMVMNQIMEEFMDGCTTRIDMKTIQDGFMIEIHRSERRGIAFVKYDGVKLSYYIEDIHDADDVTTCHSVVSLYDTMRFIEED